MLVVRRPAAASVGGNSKKQDRNVKRCSVVLTASWADRGR